MLIHFVLICLIFTHSKHLAVWEINEIVSIVRLVYYTLVASHMYKHVRYGIWRTILQHVHLSELYVVDLRVNERLAMDMLEELLGVVSDPADHTLSRLEMPWEVSRIVFRLWMLPRMGVEIALIDHTINYSIIRIFHLSEQIFSLYWPQGFG